MQSAPGASGFTMHMGHAFDDDEDDMLPHPEGDGDGGYSYGAGDGSSIPLVTKHAVEDEGDVIFDGDEELVNHGLSNGNADSSQTELVPYAHRDLKPGYDYLFLHPTGSQHQPDFICLCFSAQNRNVMIADDGSPILMDFGSTIKARIPIENRQQALLQQACPSTIGNWE